MRVGPRIQKRIRREFFPADCARALTLLTRWSTRACAPGEDPGRMLAAALYVAQGSVPALKQAISHGRGDFRDLLCPGPLGRPRVTCKPGEGPSSPDEEAFLRAIRRRPADNAARLVYADWLEERGDDRRAEYARVLCRWIAGHPAADRQLIRRERELRKGLGRWWLARVRGMRVGENGPGRGTPPKRRTRE